MKQGFPPIINNKTKILILGTFPGEESLQKQEYYGNTRNSFWKILSYITNEDLTTKSYKQKQSILLRNKIGVWDIYRQCNRTGSLDQNIKNQKLNDFKSINKKIIIFGNGQLAAKTASKLLNKEITALPSTSPANASMKFEEKLKTWTERVNQYK